MTFWTFMLLLSILSIFVIAQLVKLLNSESKAGELLRAFAWSIIEKIRHRKDPQAPPEEQ
jgi:hypothetical protein